MQYEGVVITFGTVSDSARLELNGGLEPEGKEHGERTGLRTQEATPQSHEFLSFSCVSL